MKSSNKFKAVALAAFTMAGGAVAHAVIIKTVSVGNIGNAADTAPGSLYGAVDYIYAIGKHEVTNTQYAAFLNAKAATDTFSLYNAQMGSHVLGGITQSGTSGSFTYAVKSGFENKPVSYVTFWDATRFANWLNNGQGSADTETGSYTLTSDGTSGNTVTRNVDANWVVASENEWYKAAYYDPNKGGPGVGGYWRNATRSDTLANNTAFSAANGANYNDGDFANGGLSGPGTTDVGAYANAASFYGTFDQGGNVWEWNDGIISGIGRGLRGGSWTSTENTLRSSNRNETGAQNENSSLGFRVVSLAPIP